MWPSSVFAAVFIAVALWRTLLSVLSTRARNDEIAASMTLRRSSRWRSASRSFSADNWSVTSVCVASQPPPDIGPLTSETMRPSLIAAVLVSVRPSATCLRHSGHVGIGIAGERARCGALHQELAQRRVARHVFGPQAVHFDVAFIAEHETRGAVEHAQALRHGVERRTLQAALGAPPAGREQPGEGGGAERERQCHDGAGRLRRNCPPAGARSSPVRRRGMSGSRRQSRSHPSKPRVANCGWPWKAV